MSALSLRLPASLHGYLRDVARREGVSINQLITSAVAEKMSALQTEDYLARRAERGSRAKYLAVLARVPDAEVLSGDEVSSPSRGRTVGRPRAAARRRTAK